MKRAHRNFHLMELVYKNTSKKNKKELALEHRRDGGVIWNLESCIPWAPRNRHRALAEVARQRLASGDRVLASLRGRSFRFPFLA